jgi:hypothetical protein
MDSLFRFVLRVAGCVLRVTFFSDFNPQLVTRNAERHPLQYSRAETFTYFWRP